MRSGLAAVMTVLIGGCGPASVTSDAPSSSPPALATASPGTAFIRTPGPSATVEVAATRAPVVTREIAGMEFAIVAAAADLRVDSSISRADQSIVAATVAADIPAVELEFARTFPARPVIYVFGTIETYADGFVRIFGYPRSTAQFVAENSVSFFEPSLGLIAVNWDAVGGRRPVAAMRHELTHLLTLDACSPRCDLVPAWLNEGQARLAEALVPGGAWRMQRVRYEAASMAGTRTLIPLNSLVSQFAWNALTDWAGYFKYQEAARAVELVREDIGGNAPIARLYERLRNGQNLAQAYAAITGRSFDEFVDGLAGRMTAAVPTGKGLIAVAPASYLVYGFAPASTITITVSGPRGSESTPLVISPFGSNFDTIPATRRAGGYTVSAQTESGVFTVKIRKTDTGDPTDMR